MNYSENAPPQSPPHAGGEGGISVLGGVSRIKFSTQYQLQAQDVARSELGKRILIKEDLT
jgi:hypothetical protein